MKNILLSLLLFLALTTPGKARCQLYDLTCEQLSHPIGIDAEAPRFSWKMHSITRNARQTAYQILLADAPELLSTQKANIWNSGKIRSDRSLLVPYEGRPLSPSTPYYWTVRIWDEQGKCSDWSEPTTFVTGLRKEEDWNGAKWIALEKDGTQMVPFLPFLNEEQRSQLRDAGNYRMPLFRKPFSLPEKDIKQAIVYICGLGHFDLYLNGEKVGNHFLDPGWTKYDKEALYVAFDVTEMLHSGENIFGVMLGNGFYNIPAKRYFKLAGSFGAPKMRLNLVVRYTDNTVGSIVSDKSWQAAPGPITYSCIYGGEDYDARLERCGWADNKRFALTEKGWQEAVEVEQNIRLKSQLGTQLTVSRHLPAVSVYKNEKGNWIYDLGQNFSGIIRVRLNGTAGQSVTFRPAELLNADKTVNQSASGAPYYFNYTLKGWETEEWQPRFSYYGFRYVQVEGAVPTGQENPGHLPEITELEGLHTCCELPEAGYFHCSKPLFNQIYTLIDWAIRSNSASVLTDCPHREKLGWLEQGHLMQHSIQYRYATPSIYRKMMADMAASQLENGIIPTIAPEYVRFDGGFENSPEWGSTFIISPWYIYQWYGDRSLIETYYPAMKRYVAYLTERADNHIVAYGLGDWYDIGPKAPGYAQLTSNGLTATAIYYYDVTLMRRMAALLNKTEDERYFAGLAKDIKQAYNATFFNTEKGAYDRNSQTANAISLFMGLVDEKNEPAVLNSLVEDIKGRNYALTAGDVGYRYVLRALEQRNASDIIFKMNSRYDVPGYGWQLAHGATALTESWQAYDFVSNNHFMLGHLMEWLFGGLGGLKQDETSVAYKRLYIDPQPVGDVNEAVTAYESPYGKVRCEWQRTQDTYTLHLVVPTNSEAVVCLPSARADRITEYGRPIDRQKGIRLLTAGAYKSKWLVGSGEYLFRVSLN